jgi:FtsP/CotA-like multicopper oxidase with cupredoxin domain
MLRSVDGRLQATLHFRSSEDEYSQTQYCYVTDTGGENPTLRLNPGDRVKLRIVNESRAPTNVHFHGLSIPPLVHQDEVIHTSIGPGETFEYDFRVPLNQTPGLYWYHPHLHGLTEGQVLGGASGAIVVEGFPPLRRDRILILRDQLQPGQQLNYMEPGEEQEKDVSLNFVPVTAPLATPAGMMTARGERELWRVLNASADTYFDLELLAREIGSQELSLLALDGAPLVAARRQTHILISPGGRAEFSVPTPGKGELFQLVSRSYNTGPAGASNPMRVLANVASREDAQVERKAFPSETISLDLGTLQPVRTRHLFLSEDRDDLIDPTSTAKYYITEEGATPKVFDMMSTEPGITVQQGTVEDWVIENRAREAHTFHIHQLHFEAMDRDGEPLREPLMLDTIDLPFWSGSGPFPSVKLRMDFRSPDIVGTFVYHCHILEHEDAGMMGRITVVHPQTSHGR